MPITDMNFHGCDFTALLEHNALKVNKIRVRKRVKWRLIRLCNPMKPPKMGWKEPKQGRVAHSRFCTLKVVYVELQVGHLCLIPRSLVCLAPFRLVY